MRALTVALVLLMAQPAFAQDKAAGGNDAGQDFGSPLPVGSGATLTVGNESKTVTVALSGQRKQGPLNFWQLAFSGTTGDEGEGLAFSTSRQASPGWKAKLGIGYSSFRTTLTRPNYSNPGAVLIVEAWCVTVLDAINKQLLTPAPAIDNPEGCAPVLGAVTAAFVGGGLNDQQKPEAAAAVRYVLGAFADLLADTRLREANAFVLRQFALCREFKQEAAVYYPLCPDGGAKILSIEDTRKQFPSMGEAIMPLKGVRAFQYKGSFNWMPSIASTDYHPKVDGVFDLAKEEHWTRMLHGAAFDNAFYYKSLTLGVQVSLVNAVQIKQVKVCTTTTQGDVSAEKCKDAALGEPNPGNVAAIAAALSLDPLLGPGATSFLRSGAQLTLRYENPSEGVGHSTEIAMPIYIAPTAAPMKMVVGVKPAWRHDTTDPTATQPKTFSIMFFVGAHP